MTWDGSGIKTWVERSRVLGAYYLKGLYQRLDEHHVFLMAGGLAFSTFVCIVPFVLILFAVLGTILEAGSLALQVDRLVSATIPSKPYADYVRSLLNERTRELIAYKELYGLAGVLGLLFAASGLFSSMRTVLNTIFEVREIRSEVVGKLRDFGMVFLVLCAFLISIVALPLLEGVLELISHLPLRFVLAPVVFWGKWLGSLLAMGGVFYALYALVPYGRMERRAVITGALWAAVLWWLAEQAFGYYIRNLASFDRIYGAYGLLVAVAFWIYYASVVFLLGAEIAQLSRESRVLMAGNQNSGDTDGMEGGL